MPRQRQAIAISIFDTPTFFRAAPCASSWRRFFSTSPPLIRNHAIRMMPLSILVPDDSTPSYDTLTSPTIRATPTQWRRGRRINTLHPPCPPPVSPSISPALVSPSARRGAPVAASLLPANGCDEYAWPSAEPRGLPLFRREKGVESWFVLRSWCSRPRRRRQRAPPSCPVGGSATRRRRRCLTRHRGQTGRVQR